MMCAIGVLQTLFNEMPLGATMCAGPALKATVVPGGPLTLQLSVVVLPHAWGYSKTMAVIPWSKGMK